jgi:RND superfamily putative drug exporter
VLVGLSIVGCSRALIDIPSIAPRLGTMIGLGVGIDYALFVLSRHRDTSTPAWTAESSRADQCHRRQAVVVAGGTVVVAILGLQMAGIPFVAALGYSASIVVAVAVLVAITLLPALLSVAGARVLPRSHRNAVATTAATTAASATGATADPADVEAHSGWVRWAPLGGAPPVAVSDRATFVLLLLAIPMLDMRLGQADAGTDPTTTTQRRAYDLLAAGFGDGFNGPLLIAVDLGDHRRPHGARTIASPSAATRGVRVVSPARAQRRPVTPR